MIKNLIIAGDSQSAGFTESRVMVKSYGEWIAEYRNLKLTNISDPGVDNTYIKRKLLFNIAKFSPDDTAVIFHLAPFTRKNFWFDESRPIDKDNHIWYPSLHNPSNNKIGWFRSKGKKNRVPGTKSKFYVDEFKEEFGNDFFDNYFHTYFSLLESYAETLENINAVQDYLKSRGYTYYIVVNNKYLVNESIAHKEEFKFLIDSIDMSRLVFYENTQGFDDFIFKHGYTMTNTDYHANALGHLEFSKLLNKVINL